MYIIRKRYTSSITVSINNNIIFIDVKNKTAVLHLRQNSVCSSIIRKSTDLLKISCRKLNAVLNTHLPLMLA